MSGSELAQWLAIIALGVGVIVNASSMTVLSKGLSEISRTLLRLALRVSGHPLNPEAIQAAAKEPK